MSARLPPAATPMSNDQIIQMLMRLSTSDQLTIVVTKGRRRLGHGVIYVQAVPSGKELFAMETSASSLPVGYQIHALYAGELVTMNGSFTT